MMDPYKIFTVYMVTNDNRKGSFLIIFSEFDNKIGTSMHL
jgi:hypothetical protein